MAPLPRPIGIDATLTDIATGIGNSARLLPTLSRSEIGAVAVKSAKVRLEFQMSRIIDKSSDGVELGVKTFSISAAQISKSSSRAAASQGVIELEIVAVAGVDQPEPVQPPPKVPPEDRQREAILRAIALLKQPAATMSLSTDMRKQVEVLLKSAEKAMQSGDLTAAAEAIAAIEKLLANATDPLADVQGLHGAVVAPPEKSRRSTVVDSSAKGDAKPKKTPAKKPGSNG